MWQSYLDYFNSDGTTIVAAAGNSRQIMVRTQYTVGLAPRLLMLGALNGETISH